MATGRREQTSLNGEKEERQMGTFEVDQSRTAEEKSAVDEMKEKLKKPSISLSLGIFLITNTIMFFVGITTTQNCPIRPVIPIYLAVGGALGIVTKIIPILNRNSRIAIVDYIVYALLIIEFIFMILGSYWIYSIYQPNYEEEQGDYCDKTLYLTAFWLITINYMLIALGIIFYCCVLSCLCCCAIALYECYTRLVDSLGEMTSSRD